MKNKKNKVCTGYLRLAFVMFAVGVLGLLQEGFAQLVVTQTSLASTLAQNIAGTGVTISAANLNCGSNAAGIFTYSGADLGLPGAILLIPGIDTKVRPPADGLFLNTVNGNN